MIDRNFVLNLATKSSDINEYLMTLYNIPVQINAQNIVEIGCGVSSFALMAAANKTGGRITLIDIGGPDTLNRVDGGKDLMLAEPRFRMIEEDSRLVADESSVLDIDFLFWDSEHTLELSRQEIKGWFPKVRKGGVIACHDTMHESEDKQGARIALDEYLKEHPGEYTRVDLLDTKIIGMTLLVKI